MKLKKIISGIIILTSILSYSQSRISGYEICLALKGFSSSVDADNALNRILSTIGVSKNFVLQECENVSNASALQYKGVRYIFYNKNWMTSLSNSNDYKNIFILAHEVGHHINGHTLDYLLYVNNNVSTKSLLQRRQQELEADEFAGFILSKLGASLYETTEVLYQISDNSDDTYSTHPNLDKRIYSVKKGYSRAKENNKKDKINSYFDEQTLLLDSGARWEGPIKIVKSSNTTTRYPNGEGTLYEKDGSIYKGRYIDGLKNGYGEKYYTDGSIYKGNWLNGSKSGKGIQDDRNSPEILWPYIKFGVTKKLEDCEAEDLIFSRRGNEVYEGFFSNNQPNGRGKLTRYTEKGEIIYEGIWDGWKMNGQGKIILENGEIWEGYMYGFQLEGYGTKKYPNGVISEGVWGTESWLSKGELEFDNGNYRLAIVYLNDAIKQEKSGFAYNLLGLCYKELKQYDFAIENYSLAISLDNDEPVFYTNRANIKWNQEKYEEAISDYSKAVNLEPTADRYNRRGLCYDRLAQYDFAIENYSLAISLDNDEPIFYVNRAIIKRNQEKYEEAISDYSKAIDLEPTSSRFNSRGFCYDRLEQYDFAIENYSLAISLDNDEPIFYTNRAIIKWKQEKYEEAISDYSKAINLEPTASRFNSRAKVKIAQKKFKHAEIDLKESLKLDQNQKNAYYTYSQLYWEKGEFEKSEKINVKIIAEIDKNDARAHGNLAYIFEKTNEYNKSCFYFNKAISLGWEFSESGLNKKNKVCND